MAEVDLVLQRDLPGVDPEDLLAAGDVGPVDGDVAVEPAGPDQRGVERLGPVGGGHHDHAEARVEPVHRDQELIQGLVALVVAAGPAGPPGLAQGVELVDEDQAGGLGRGLGEQAPDPGRADADEHLDEVGAREREERHAGLARDRLGQQGLARARRADQEDPLGDPAAEGLELLGGPEEVDDLAKLGDDLVGAGDVVEGDPALARCRRPCAGSGRRPPPSPARPIACEIAQSTRRPAARISSGISDRLGRRVVGVGVVIAVGDVGLEEQGELLVALHPEPRRPGT